MTAHHPQIVPISSLLPDDLAGVLDSAGHASLAAQALRRLFYHHSCAPSQVWVADGALEDEDQFGARVLRQDGVVVLGYDWGTEALIGRTHAGGTLFWPWPFRLRNHATPARLVGMAAAPAFLGALQALPPVARGWAQALDGQWMAGWIAWREGEAHIPEDQMRAWTRQKEGLFALLDARMAAIGVGRYSVQASLILPFLCRHGDYIPMQIGDISVKHEGGVGGARPSDIILDTRAAVAALPEIINTTTPFYCWINQQSFTIGGHHWPLQLAHTGPAPVSAHAYARAHSVVAAHHQAAIARIGA